MSKIVKAFKAIRNNWKKSVFGFSVLLYGAQYGKNKYDTFQLMRGYCEEAFKYGTVPLPVNSRCRHVTVILNPAANRRKAKKDFDKFCAPLLHLAGIIVNVLQTEYEGQARNIMETTELLTDAVVIAGGDGTLSEAITGLLRRPNADLVLQRQLPLGVLPLGRTNTIAHSLYGNADTVKMMADATMSVIREATKPVDVMKVQVIEEEGERKPPVYSVAGLEWGAYRDTVATRDKYWYWGALRSYAAFVFMGLKSKENVTWECNGNLQYVLPCSGCSRCYVIPQNTHIHWWHAFIPKHSTQAVQEDYTRIPNEECGKEFEEEISTLELEVAIAKSEQGTTHMRVSIGPKTVSYVDFVTEGWRRLRNVEPRREQVLHVGEMKFKPTLLEKQISPKWISIDNEDYELKPLHIKLLKNKLNLFCIQ